jgi:hypothetical protein
MAEQLSELENLTSIAPEIVIVENGFYQTDCSRSPKQIKTYQNRKLATPFSLKEYGQLLALIRLFALPFHLYSYGGKGVEHRSS